eukprot:254653_1
MHLLVFNSLFGDSDSPGVVGTVIPTVGYHTIRLQIGMHSRHHLVSSIYSYPTTTLTTTHPSNTQSPITALPTTALSTNAVPTSVSPTTAFPTRTTASKAATIAVHITDPSSESPSVFFFFYY